MGSLVGTFNLFLSVAGTERRGDDDGCKLCERQPEILTLTTVSCSQDSLEAQL